MKKLIVVVTLMVLLVGCTSRYSVWSQNVMGTKLEAYWSQNTNTVCFTTSSGGDNIYCLPASAVNTSMLTPGEWVVA